MSETSALFLLDSLDPLILRQIRTLARISQYWDLQYQTQIRSVGTTATRHVPECLTPPARREEATYTHALRRFVFEVSTLNCLFLVFIFNVMSEEKKKEKKTRAAD